MAEFGKIKSFDTGSGNGWITPEKGGDALAFARADMQKKDVEPKADQRFGYDLKDEGGKHHAVNLRMEAQPA